MKLKKSSGLYKDYITKNLLLGIAITFLVIAVILEFGCLIEHDDFWINVLLGASASSIISFVMIAIPYNNCKKQEMENFNIARQNIYAKYLYLEKVIRRFDSKSIRIRATILLDLVNDFSIMYNNMNFYSNESSEKYEIIAKQIPNKLKNIDSYLDIIDAFLNDLENFYTREEISVITESLYDIFVRTIDLNSINVPYNEFQVLREVNQELLNGLIEIKNGMETINNSKEIIVFNNEIQICFTQLTNKILKERANKK